MVTRMVLIDDLILSAVEGDRNAQLYLARAYRDGNDVEKDEFESMRWFEAAAKNGHRRAKYELAILLESEGPVHDTERAIKLLKELSDAGDVDSKYHLAKCYLEGAGVEKDRNAAEELLYSCIRKGSQRAKTKLADLYYNDEAYENHLKSQILYHELAMEGDKNAMFKLYIMYKGNSGMRKDPKIAGKWLQAAADAGHEKAAKLIQENSSS